MQGCPAYRPTQQKSHKFKLLYYMVVRYAGQPHDAHM